MNQIAPMPDPENTPLDQIDFSDPRLLRDDTWHGYFARLRNESPVHYQADSPFGPFWSITRFEDIVAVDSNFADFSSEPTILIGDVSEDIPAEMFIAMDPPKHDEQRRAVQGVVAPKNLAEMEVLIRSRVCNILDGLPVGETFDWVDAVSINLTTQMLATLFDFPFEDRAKLTYWSDIAAGLPEMTGGQVDPQERYDGLMDCLATFTQLWHERKAAGSEGFDLISLLQRDENTADMVDRPMEFIGNLMLLIVGGNDTTRNSATGGVLALNEFPAEYDKLRADPGLIPSMVSEIIRWQTPLAHMRRRATRDLEFGGQQIRKDDKVVMWYMSGNRDERTIDNPDQFIIDRENPRHHISFGFGVHRCMGNRLAEMQLRILWEEIMQRFRFVEVVGEPQRVHSNFVKGYESLPVRLHPL
ncbi:cytochrome P450 [Pseudohalioglobus sediminis]|uniref:Cytochrome P450 n=1 Tax=Pseudohalioglobus sediminis TaxID=2606449 RepID=A0A5B0X5B6_9GAMM|nr:cytochrome P450 [Pseudohalioglobus sediminis]KAA1193379.1 cytochrome P450 [Pseudohalioglobus sediminis]